MIGYLKGDLLENTECKLLVVVSSGVNGGQVGYAVSVPQNDSYRNLPVGQSIELFVHTHVREDALDLFGFQTRVEKDIFITLLSVTGIGPKGALGILSKMEPSALIRAIAEEDRDSLTAMPGIGKKTADRIVLELADSIRKKWEAGTFSPSEVRNPARLRAKPAYSAEGHVFRDAKAALIGLGYRDQDAQVMINRVMAEDDPPKRVEEVIRTALRQPL